MQEKMTTGYLLLIPQISGYHNTNRTQPNPMEEAPCKRSRTNDDAGTGSLAGGGDRLSALPDCLLHEIMSRMRARQVVQMCVLST
jgi:hypothetical protein